MRQVERQRRQQAERHAGRHDYAKGFIRGEFHFMFISSNVANNRNGPPSISRAQ